MAPISSPTSKSPTNHRHRHIPEHFLHSAILPRLSSKTLSRFKSVSKSFHAVISDDPIFASDQSRCLSTCSQGILYQSHRGLQFLDSPHTGLPDRRLSFLADPSLGFVPGKPVNLQLVASANGLLCLFLGHPCLSLYVLNPVTRHGHLIPNSQSKTHVGLAFDPSAGRYTLVQTDRHKLLIPSPRVEHRFSIYSSDTGKWVQSTQIVIGLSDSWWGQSNPLYAGGLLYWDCSNYLIWFDPANDRAGSVPLPLSWSPTAGHDISVSDGRLTYVRTGDDGLEVWKTTSRPSSSCLQWEWEKRHKRSWEELLEANPEAFPLCHRMKLRQKRPVKRYFSWWKVRPIAVREEKVYLGIKALRWNRTRKTNTWAFCSSFCYDLRTGKVEDVGKIEDMPDHYFNPFISYHNTMVALPKLPRSEDDYEWWRVFFLNFLPQ